MNEYPILLRIVTSPRIFKWRLSVACYRWFHSFQNGYGVTVDWIQLHVLVNHSRIEQSYTSQVSISWDIGKKVPNFDSLTFPTQLKPQSSHNMICLWKPEGKKRPLRSIRWCVLLDGKSRRFILSSIWNTSNKNWPIHWKHLCTYSIKPTFDTQLIKLSRVDKMIWGSDKAFINNFPSLVIFKVIHIEHIGCSQMLFTDKNK